jgi:predicted DNA-binding protein
MKRRNFYLPDEVVSELKTVADKRGTTISHLIRGALEAWLKAYKRQQEVKHGQ